MLLGEVNTLMKHKAATRTERGEETCTGIIDNRLITDLLTHSMQQNPSWEANRFSVKKFPTFYGTWRFITTFTSACHLSLSSATSIQSLPSHPTPWRSLFILSSHLRLGLPNGLFPSGFSPTPCAHLYPNPIRATCPAHLIRLDFTTRTILLIKLLPYQNHKWSRSAGEDTPVLACWRHFRRRTPCNWGSTRTWRRCNCTAHGIVPVDRFLSGNFC